MAKGNNFKKPVNNNQELIINEDEKNKKLIIIVCLSIIVVLGLIIASISYFNNRQVEEDKKNNKSDNPNEVIKKPVEEKPVVDETPTVVKPTYNYKPSKPVAVVTPEEQPEETPVISSDTDDYTVTIEENNVVKISGVSRYFTKVEDPTQSGYNNFIRVKVTLDSKYKLEDLSSLVITTRTITGYNNYGTEVLSSTPEEIEAGNLYFYWTQAVGDGMPKNPSIKIDYGDGNSEIYTLDLSELTIETPIEEELANQMVVIRTDDEVIGGQVITYEIIVLEERSSDEIEFDDEATLASDTNEVENNDDLSIVNDDEGVDTDPDTPEVPEDKSYTIKFTGTANYYDRDVVAGLDLGLDEYNYILSVKVLAPSDISDDEIKNYSLTITKQDGTKQDLSGAEGVIKELNGLKFIYLYYAIDEVPVQNPVFTIDWDGEGTKYGKITYTFDMSELDKAEPSTEGPENGTPDEGAAATQSEVQDGNSPELPETQVEPEVSSTLSTMNEVNVNSQINMDMMNV